MMINISELTGAVNMYASMYISVPFECGHSPYRRRRFNQARWRAYRSSGCTRREYINLYWAGKL